MSCLRGPSASWQCGDGSLLLPKAAHFTSIDIPADLRALLVTCSGKEAYPITGFTWGLTRKNYTSGDEATLKEMTNFLWWCSMG
jgi:hypothetical protein